MARRNQRSPEAQEYRRHYRTARWQHIRSMRLADEPVCRMCLPRVTPAVLVDHVKEHKGDLQLFFDYTNTQSLCMRCHSSVKQAIERSESMAVDADGWPVEAS